MRRADKRTCRSHYPPRICTISLFSEPGDQAKMLNSFHSMKQNSYPVVGLCKVSECLLGSSLANYRPTLLIAALILMLMLIQ